MAEAEIANNPFKLTLAANSASMTESRKEVRKLSLQTGSQHQLILQNGQSCQHSAINLLNLMSRSKESSLGQASCAMAV